MMYNIITKQIVAAAFLITCSLSAQVIINANPLKAKTVPTGPSVLLEFGDDNDKGIIMPYVETIPDNAKEGTIIYYANFTDVNVSAYTLVYKNAQGTWVSLSTQSASETEVASITDVQDVEGIEESPNAKTIIGAATSEKDGILVLESSNKAMVLPIVDNLDNIKSPSLGMMVYYNRPGVTDNTREPYLAVYGGNGVWDLWKPNDATY